MEGEGKVRAQKGSRGHHLVSIVVSHSILSFDERNKEETRKDEERKKKKGERGNSEEGEKKDREEERRYQH